MKQSELIAAVAERSGLSKADVSRVLVALREVVMDGIAHQQRVPLVGLGSLQPRQLRPRTIRSIGDMRKLRIGQRWSVRFRPSSRLREILQGMGPQQWRDPAHQSAWRLAETLVADLDLYHGARAPSLTADAGDALVHSACAGAFGGLWTRVLDSYQQRTPDDVRVAQDYLADAARQRWAA